MSVNSKGLREYKRNKINPFLEEAIEKIDSHLVKKYRSSTGTSRAAILTAVDENNIPVGHTSFIRQIEVDDEQFTKIYLSQFSAFWNLKSSSMKVFGYIMTKLVPKQDMFFFLIDECKEHTSYKAEKSIYLGLANLIENKIIARGPTESVYFINPMVAFNGNRVTFAKTYIKKRKTNKSIKIDPNQTKLL
jgi:hypothetical protein